ncbi:hypothetical protein GH714_003443 [Hevea brasiliensis]|uniref:Photosystem II D1 processing protein PSB27-H2, chloroplastic n=1 Tax=Hevea brasiliensis TaxID=3981 RepID=A0A6A6K984_HEVBR|nr:hypothetical protein GH714_003443 [Hevea brasiliensis]
MSGKLQLKCNSVVSSQAASSSRRHILVCSASFLAIQNLNCISMPLPVRAEEESNDQEEKDGVVGAIKSLFDRSEKTKSGKLLPRAYLKSAREESYVELEKAIRCLASFYSKAGPSAPLPEKVRSEILNDLSTAEEFL